jgi:serine/threonine protein kinase
MAAAALAPYRSDKFEPFTPYNDAYRLVPTTPYLGSGTSGSVFCCTHKDELKPVALKIYNTPSFTSFMSFEPGHKTSYSNTSSYGGNTGDHLISLLPDHPHLLKYHRFIIKLSDGEILSLTKSELNTFLTTDDSWKSFTIKAVETEYIDGENIHGFKDGKRHSLRINEDQFKTIVKVMHFLNEHNFTLGKDIAQNIMIDRFGCVKFIDFTLLGKGTNTIVFYKTIKILYECLEPSSFKENLEIYISKLEAHNKDNTLRHMRDELFLSDPFYQEIITSP